MNCFIQILLSVLEPMAAYVLYRIALEPIELVSVDELTRLYRHFLVMRPSYLLRLGGGLA